jgi:hypothetical protein
MNDSRNIIGKGDQIHGSDSHPTGSKDLYQGKIGAPTNNEPIGEGTSDLKTVTGKKWTGTQPNEVSDCTPFGNRGQPPR